MSVRRFVVGFVGFSCVVAFSILWAIGFFQEKDWTDYSRSVLQFAGPDRSGVFYIDEISDSISLKEWGPQDLFQGASKHQVLIYKDHQRELLIWGFDQGDAGPDFQGELRAFNLNSPTGTLAWSASLGARRLYSTPIILASRKEIWTLSEDRSTADSKVFVPVLQSYDLEGVKKCELSLDLGERAERLHCATGLAFDTQTQSLVFGCSASQVRNKDMYGRERGRMGGIVIAHLPANGCPTAKEIRQWSAAEVRDEDPRTGYDTGIWMSGAAPLTPGDGSVWLTTGNGYFAPELGNYGCSVLRIDLTSLKPSVRVVWAHDQVSGSLRSQECSAMNIDPSSSGLSFQRPSEFKLAASSDSKKNRTVPWSYILLGKDSILKWGRGDVPEIPFQRRVAWFLNYGQPAAHMDSSFRSQVWTTITVPRSFAIVDELWEESAPDKCEVVFRRERGTGDGEEIQLYFSGNYRQDRIAAAAGSKAATELVSITSFWSDPEISYRHPVPTFPPYVIERSLGWTMVNDTSLAADFELRPFWVERGEGHFDLRPRFQSDRRQSLPAGRVWVPNTAAKCTRLNPKDYSFYRLVSNTSFPSLTFQNRLDSYRLAGGSSATRVARWSESDPTWSWSRSSPAVGMTPSGRVVVAASLVDTSLQSSRILLIDPYREKTLADVKIEGTPHFSMPTFYGNKVFISTRSPNRLYAFTLEASDSKVESR